MVFLMARGIMVLVIVVVSDFSFCKSTASAQLAPQCAARVVGNYALLEVGSHMMLRPDMHLLKVKH